jgi:hypothetical protein
VLKTLASRHRYRTLAAVAAVAATIAIVGSAVASQLASGVDTYTGCVSTSGDLSKFAKGTAPAKSCTGSQVQVSFSGPLPSGCAEGDVLAWRSNAWTCAADGATDAFVVLRSPRSIPLNTVVRVATMHLDPGAYVVTGRVDVRAEGNASDPPANVSCLLIAADDSDSATLRLSPSGAPGDSAALALFASEELSEPGDVQLECNVYGNVSGATADHIAVRAVEVGSITTDQEPGPLP